VLPHAPCDIRIDGLTARWRPDGPDVLRGVSLVVPAGQRVVITGPSGSGKTTLAMVLLRFLDPAAGTVTLGGVDITTLDGDALRTVIGLCAQDAHIFDSTLTENLRLARPEASDADLREALRRARLLDWAESLPDGLDTAVGEHGARLSGGQRQRLALARVLLADFPVVILDEPAEHLDEETAAALTHDLLEETCDRTVLLISHRTSVLDAADQILRLQDGAIAQLPPVSLGLPSRRLPRGRDQSNPGHVARWEARCAARAGRHAGAGAGQSAYGRPARPERRRS
jgi:ABC-type multidrug transport system fused ATPase/permease subunit